MSIVRRLARPLLAAPFVLEGVEHVRHPGPRVESARPLVSRLAEPLRLPDDPEMLVRANGAAMAVAGSLLATGRLPRLAAAVLAATVVPATYVENAFWAEKDPERKAAQRTRFLTSLGLLGGALLASVDTDGRPGLAWRSERAAKDAKRAAGLAKRDAKRAGRLAKHETRTLTKGARREARLARAKVEAAVG
jgi:putative oxidoreductase